MHNTSASSHGNLTGFVSKQEDEQMGIRTSYKQGTPSWVDLATSDQDGAKSFYGSLFGWSWDDNDMGDGSTYSMAQLKGKSAAAAYTQRADEASQGIPPHWTTYITVDDADAVAGKVAGAGGQVFMEPMDVFDSGRMAVASDPTGAVIAFWQPKAHIGSEIVNEAGALAWNELITDDVDKAAAFFKAVLGVDVMNQTEPFPYSMLMVDEKPVGGFMAKSPEMGPMPNVWVVYFSVDDADSTAAKAESLGGKIMVPPMDTPVGRFAGLTDPQGALFSVIKLNEVTP